VVVVNGEGHAIPLLLQGVQRLELVDLRLRNPGAHPFPSKAPLQHAAEGHHEGTHTRLAREIRSHGLSVGRIGSRFRPPSYAEALEETREKAAFSLDTPPKRRHNRSR
jgi:hypothetical protein